MWNCQLSNYFALETNNKNGLDPTLESLEIAQSFAIKMKLKILSLLMQIFLTMFKNDIFIWCNGVLIIQRSIQSFQILIQSLKVDGYVLIDCTIKLAV